MSELDTLALAASGMDAQRIALEASARNVAAAQTTGSTSFTRLVPQFETVAGDDDDLASDLDGNSEGAPMQAAGAIRFTGMRSERAADVDAMTEMVSVLDAQRAYEANASVFDEAKRFTERAIDLGRL